MNILFCICLQTKMLETSNVRTQTRMREPSFGSPFKRLYLVLATGNLRVVMTYSAREYCDIYFNFGQCNGKVLLTATEYALLILTVSLACTRKERKGVCASLSITPFSWCQSNPRFGWQTKKYRKHPTDMQSPKYWWKNAWLAFANTGRCRWVGEIPELSTLALIREVNANSTDVHKLLRVEGVYPLRYTLGQFLHPDDLQLCIDLCEWLLQQNEFDNAFISHIWWKDKVCLTHEGVFNSNSRHMGPSPIFMQSSLKYIRSNGL